MYTFTKISLRTYQNRISDEDIMKKTWKHGFYPADCFLLSKHLAIDQDHDEGQQGDWQAAEVGQNYAPWWKKTFQTGVELTNIL